MEGSQSSSRSSRRKRDRGSSEGDGRSKRRRGMGGPREDQETQARMRELDRVYEEQQRHNRDISAMALEQEESLDAARRTLEESGQEMAEAQQQLRHIEVMLAAEERVHPDGPLTHGDSAEQDRQRRELQRRSIANQMDFLRRQEEDLRRAEQSARIQGAIQPFRAAAQSFATNVGIVARQAMDALGSAARTADHHVSNVIASGARAAGTAIGEAARLGITHGPGLLDANQRSAGLNQEWESMGRAAQASVLRYADDIASRISSSTPSALPPAAPGRPELVYQPGTAGRGRGRGRGRSRGRGRGRGRASTQPPVLGRSHSVGGGSRRKSSRRRSRRSALRTSRRSALRTSRRSARRTARRSSRRSARRTARRSGRRV